MPFVILAAALLAVPIALLSPGDFWRGALAAFGLLFAALALLRAAWKWGGGGRGPALLIALAFMLRLGGGIALSQAYRAWGYEKPVYQLGYLFPDAMERDIEAYQVGVSGAPLLFNPELHLGADQYGGLGLLSAALYRFLSPDAHRPYLVLILGAACFALGVPFLRRAAAARWGAAGAALALWIYILYPDGIFFTLAQMREPFIIGFSAVALWGALSWRENLKGALAAGFLGLLAILPISPPAAAFLAIVLALLVWIDFSAVRSGRGWKWIALAGIACGGLALAAASYNFLRVAANWDASLAETGSGMVANVVSQIPERFRLPFITFYGLTRPLLPAAVFEPSIPLMKTLILLRALGWYALLPLLIYAPVAVRLTRPGIERLRALWLAVIPWVWLLVAALRAGGDESDNPRYRLILLVVLCVTAAWAWSQARSHKDPWFGRILLCEGLFLLFFGQWYAARYLETMIKLPFLTMLVLMAGAIGLVLAGGFAWDRLRARR